MVAVFVRSLLGGPCMDVVSRLMGIGMAKELRHD